jgi:AraC-like DNA-binding protein
MNYFDDIDILSGEAIPHCRAFLDRSFPGTYSVEFIGGGRMSFGIDGSKEKLMDFPAVFWHHPRHRYRYGAVDDDGWDHHYVLMKGPRAKSLVEKGFMPLSRKGYVKVINPASVEVIFHEMLSLLEKRKPLVSGEILTRLERLLCILAQERKENRSGNIPGADAFRDLADKLSLRPELDWDFEKEARSMKLSFSHFRRRFREMNSAPPHDHLLSCRLKKASRELRKGGKSVKEVAADCGFNDYPHFCCIFRKKLGTSPGRYAKMFEP